MIIARYICRVRYI